MDFGRFKSSNLSSLYKLCIVMRLYLVPNENSSLKDVVRFDYFTDYIVPVTTSKPHIFAALFWHRISYLSVTFSRNLMTVTAPLPCKV